MKRLNLFIDADDTLLDFDKAESKAINSTFKDYNLLRYDGIIESYKRNNLKAWKQFEQNIITRDDISTMRFEWVFNEFGIEGIDLNQINKDYWGYLAKGDDVIEGAREFCEWASKINNLYVITNGTAFIQNSRFKSSGMDKYFIKRYISETLNTRKPAKEFFDYIEKDLGGVDRDVSYIIGDSLSSDMQLGINCGIKTIFFNRENKINKDNMPIDYVVKDFIELKALIEKIMEG